MITVYSKANCPQCNTLKGQLALAKIEYVEVRVDLNPEHRDFLLNEGHRSVPQMYDGLTHLGSKFADLK